MGAGMIACQYCGTPNRADATYCNSCGGLLPGATPATPHAAPSGRPAAPSRPVQHGTGRLPPQSKLAGHYLILKNVGQGGMAAVYRASDTRTRRIVAVKEMGQDTLSPDELTEALASFRFEAQTLMRLRHPNLPRVYEEFSEGARHYLVMEFIDGQTLEQRLGAAGGGGLPEVEVLGWARQLCSALGYLHGQRPPIIFRDLKPSNIMVTRKGEVKLIDFGIARVFAPGRTRDTQVLGTPGYAPPEQYGKAQTDARADIYALGCTLYQLLTGYDPATTPFALPPLHSRNPRVAPHVQLAIERATRLDREARYQTVAAFEQDLLHPAGMYFRTGECARNRSELVALCLRQPAEAAEHLYAGRIEGWLRAWGDTAAAESAVRAARTNPTDRSAGLRAFVAGVSAGPASAGSARGWANPGANPKANAAAGAAASSSFNASSAAASGAYAAPRARSATATRAAASAATAAAPIVVVQPRSVSFGRLVAGQRGTQVFLVSAQGGGSVSGRITSPEPWLVVDHAQFNGASTIVQLWAETSKIAGYGVQQANVEIMCGSQRIYLPVTVEVLAPGGRSAKPAAKPPAAPATRTGGAAGGGPASASASAAAGPAASSARVAAPQATGVYGATQPSAAARSANQTHPVSPKYALAPPSPSRLVRLVTSFALAFGLAVGALWQLPTLLARLNVGGAGSWPVDVLALAVAMLLAIPGAWAGAAPWRTAGRLRATAIGATTGAAIGLLAAGPVVFTHHGALVLAALASVGAAFGADSMIGRAILAAANFVTRRIQFFLSLAAMVGGAWAGVVLAGRTGVGLLVPLGLILGLIVGGWVGARLYQLLSHMTRVARTYP